MILSEWCERKFVFDPSSTAKRRSPIFSEQALPFEKKEGGDVDEFFVDEFFVDENSFLIHPLPRSGGPSFWKKEGDDVDEIFVDEIFLDENLWTKISWTKSLERKFANKNLIFHVANAAHVLPSFFKRKDVRRYRMDQNTSLTSLDQPSIKNL